MTKVCVKCFKQSKGEKMYCKSFFCKFFYPFELLYYMIHNFFYSFMFFFTFRKNKKISMEELQKEVEF